jgi:hypothetical protein
LYCFTLSPLNVVAQTDSIPEFTIKWHPTYLLDVDQNIQFSGEYFLDDQQSIQLSYGFGNSKIFSSKKTSHIARLEYRRFFKPFNNLKRGRNYWAPEILYKNIVEEESLQSFTNFQNYNALFRNHIAALNVSFGRAYVSAEYFPAIDIYFGLGVRALYNYLEYIPPGFTDSISQGMFGRSQGFYFFPSLKLGIGIGIGKWKPKNLLDIKKRIS